MSRRIRTIKPEILDDDKTAGLSHVAWRLFVSGLTLSDDHGNLRAGVTYLAGQVFHSCPHTDSDAIRTAVDELIEAGLWQVYTVRGQTYAHIRGWSKHQRIDNAGKPRVPPPGEADGTRPISAPCEEKAFAANRRESPRVAASRRGSRLDQDQEGDQEGTKTQSESAGAGAPAPARAFDKSPDTSPSGRVVAEVVSTEPPPSCLPPVPVEVAPSVPATVPPSCPVAAPLAAFDAEDDDQPPPAQRVPSTPRPEPVAQVAPAAPVEAAPPVAPAPPVAAPSSPVAAPSEQLALVSPAEAPAVDPVAVVFDHWRETVWKSRAVLNDRRRSRIAARIAEGYSVDDLKRVADGVLRDDWLMGRADGARPEGWRDVETVFRDAAQVERLIKLAALPPDAIRPRTQRAHYPANVAPPQPRDPGKIVSPFGTVMTFDDDEDDVPAPPRGGYRMASGDAAGGAL